MIATTTKPAPLIELRGESGRLYGKLDPATGIIHMRRGSERDRVDMSAYIKAAQIKPVKDAVQ